MSDSGNQSAAALFAITGTVKVHLLDGQILEGDFSAQDAFNIFISVADTPMMIPRTQVRYLQGQPGQAVVVDSGPFQAEPKAVPDVLEETTAEEKEQISPIVQPVAMEDEPAPRERQKTDESIGTVIAPPPVEPEVEKVAEPMIDSLLDADDGTVVLEPDALSSLEEKHEAQSDEEEDGTFIFGLVSEAEEDQTFVLDSSDDAELTDVLTPVSPNDEPDTTVVVPLTGRDAELTATLSVTSGPHNGDKFTLRSGITTMGRSSDNVIVLSKDKESSRHHAIIVHETGQYVIQDQNSLNGTFVNDEQINGPYYLKDGDRILVGLSTLEYRLA